MELKNRLEKIAPRKTVDYADQTQPITALLFTAVALLAKAKEFETTRRIIT
jgi:hypothetical protein